MLLVVHQPLFADLSRMDMQSFSQEGRDTKRHDPARFLTTLFAPDDVRPALWTVYAFNAELGRIRDTVTEPVLGHIRFQWWRDTLGELTSSSCINSPAVQGLATLIRTYGLPVSLFQDLVEARSMELDATPFATWNDLHACLDRHGGVLAEIGCRISGTDELSLVEAARKAGMAIAAARTLRNALRFFSSGHCPVPVQIISNLKLDESELGTQEGLEKLSSWVLELCRQGRSWISSARAKARNPERRVLSVFLEAIIAERTFSVLEANGGNLMAPRLYLPDRRALGMTWRALRGRW